ncbi:DUF421 domain-containing protein [Nannocystis pusilla]|uniref:DUF421 domain-containing protein n=1 Tax=Nannocystis pusilla TaxID=889268 RepID=A0ABS7TYN2_9BACT|nr:YetF domain-containing protein [Nannocystis pusilla]MBZ5713378.1 DUF421 domain-containing protein [Nannocystis pusilla]
MDTVIRVVVVYLLVMACMRMMGKREFGQLSPAELVTLLIIPEIVSPALVRDDPSLTNALVGATTLFSLVFLVSLAMHHIKPLERAISGEPTLLVRRGRFLVGNMNRERISPDEIYSEMHKVGLHRIDQVQWVVLEPDGKLAVIPRPDHAELPRAESPLDE